MCISGYGFWLEVCCQDFSCPLNILGCSSRLDVPALRTANGSGPVKVNWFFTSTTTSPQEKFQMVFSCKVVEIVRKSMSQVH
ncbi:hypothetical protein Nepgr_012108 [Nepenthes gracilis]|uniref:Uncharacterized protein n=1 Tax=Nepenthes gracilis TaxID=150966 RepID=A0AAD3SFG9_NEPGR|nr:hypothetical protein Nepgr_012108 [Nepenthes gracilis]